ncbi:MAG TPA: hypothetical protein DDW65_11360 [Firmicutes bacterium]|jgi:hypothetical protein|nr:hypothetical protein [Bacillota bacterium]
MEKYYDVMYREDYDWWTFACTFNTLRERIEELQKYEFSGEDDLGVTVESNGDRVIVAIYCRIDASFTDGSYDEYDEDENEEDYEDEEEDGENGREKGMELVAEDELLNLLVQVRRQLIDGDCRTLYAVWEKYGDFDDEKDKVEISIPADKNAGKNIVEQFKNMLD